MDEFGSGRDSRERAGRAISTAVVTERGVASAVTPGNLRVLSPEPPSGGRQDATSMERWDI